MNIFDTLTGLFGKSPLGAMGPSLGAPAGGSPFQGMMQGMQGSLPGMDMQGTFGQANPFNSAMPNLVEPQQAVTYPLGVTPILDPRTPPFFPSGENMPNVLSPTTEEMLKTAQLAGMPFNREQRPSPPPGGIHRMNQMAPYQFGAARMFKP